MSLLSTKHVLTVVILSLLGIFMVRYFILSQRAHDMDVQTSTQVMQAAISLAHAKWLAKGQPTSGAPIAGMDFLNNGYANIGFNEKGWPNAASRTQDISVKHILGQAENNHVICAQIMKNLIPFSSITIEAGKRCTANYCATYQDGVCIYTYQKNKKVLRTIRYSPNDGEVTKAVEKKAKYSRI